MKKLCQACNTGTEMTYGAKEILIKYGTLKPRPVPNVLGWHCPACGECEFAPGEGMQCIETLEAMKLEMGERVLK